MRRRCSPAGAAPPLKPSIGAALQIFKWSLNSRGRHRVFPHRAQQPPSRAQAQDGQTLSSITLFDHMCSINAFDHMCSTITSAHRRNHC